MGTGPGSESYNQGRLMPTAIGIDLGTTYTCAAIVEDGAPHVILSRLGYSTIPSVVTFDEEGQPMVGQQAERRMILSPEDTIYGSKRLLGRAYGAGIKMEFQPHFHYELVPGEDGLVAAKVNGNTTSLIEVSSLILHECRKAAEESLGRPVNRAVVTVPAYFNETQRACVRMAGAHAGLEIIRVINEPTAAALCYGASEATKRLLVFDLGGGTFDVSVVKVSNNIFEVEAVDGDNFLGGIDFDQLLVGHILERIAEKHGDKLEISKVDRERLRSEAQQAKHELSSQEKTMISLAHLDIGGGKLIDVAETLTREDLETATTELVDHCVAIVTRTLARRGLKPEQIDDVLLVGGQTRMPMVQERLEGLFGRPPSKRVHPDEVVALGAAIAAFAHDKIDAPVLLDVVPMSISIAIGGGGVRTVVPHGTPLPHSAKLEFKIPGDKKAVTLAVLQGDEPRARDNDYLGAIVLDQLPETEMPCRLDFELDAESILRVYATIPGWGERTPILPDRTQSLGDILAGLGETQADTPSTSRAVPLKRGLVGKILRRLRKRRKRSG
jgi:molecular chaperone DnaK